MELRRKAMNKVKTLAATIIASTSLLAVSAQANAESMSPYIETALVDVCKSALTDSPMRMSQTIKSYRLNEKTVALNVVCNGDDIIAFASKHGAERTATRLNSRLGGVSIQDVAKHQKMSVSFSE